MLLLLPQRRSRRRHHETPVPATCPYDTGHPKGCCRGARRRLRRGGPDAFRPRQPLEPPLRGLGPRLLPAQRRLPLSQLQLPLHQGSVLGLQCRPLDLRQYTGRYGNEAVHQGGISGVQGCPLDLKQ